MSTAFVKAVQLQYPNAAIDVIAKKNISFLLDYFPAHNQRFIFDKEEHKGLTGAYRFGKQLSRQKNYDIFFCLPNSFSSAIMAYASGAKKRTGYKKELRSPLLTNSISKKNNLHRVDEYLDLLQQFTGTQAAPTSVELKINTTEKTQAVVVNINSEASSRRLPPQKAKTIIDVLRKNFDGQIILIGSEKEAAFVQELYQSLANTNNIVNKAGATSLPQLLELLGSCAVMLTTDSGPAHVANALGTHTVVLFGAGNEQNTAPYNISKRTIIRLGKLACEPCVNNTCKVYGTPKCLTALDENIITQSVLAALKNN
jgi:heptosyltransferase II